MIRRGNRKEMVVIAKGNNHDPVMLDRVVELLAPSLAVPDAVYVDCTLGLGGHARAVLEAAPSARLIGIDRDPEALAVARERLGSFAERIVLVKAVYDELPGVLADLEQEINAEEAKLADYREYYTRGEQKYNEEYPAQTPNSRQYKKYN